jgi:carbon storage regulator
VTENKSSARASYFCTLNLVWITDLEKIFKSFADFSDNNSETSLDLVCGFWIWDLNITNSLGFSSHLWHSKTLLWEEAGQRGHDPQQKTIWWGDGMLVLTRKIGEVIHIGEDIEIVVTAIEQNKVKIGIRSPRQIPVYRQELYQRIRQGNREAARMEADDLEKMLEFLPRGSGTIFDPKTDSDA